MTENNNLNEHLNQFLPTTPTIQLKNQFGSGISFESPEEKMERRGSRPETYFKVTDHLDRGTVKINVVMARNLIGTDLNGKSDPYVVITCQDQKWKSKMLPKTLNPVWNETCTFKLKKINQSTTILVRIFDHDFIGSDDPLGECHIFCAGITKDEVVSWHKLEKTEHGEIELGISADFELQPFEPLVTVGEGTLSVKLNKGRNLIAADLNGKSDPYCIISFQENYFETKVIQKTLNPVWEQSFDLKLSDINQRTILPIIVMDEDEIGSDDFIGLALLPLAGLKSGETKTKWYDLHGVKHGEIEVEFKSDFDLPNCPPVFFETAIESSTFRVKNELKNLLSHHNHSKTEVMDQKKKDKDKKVEERKDKIKNGFSKIGSGIKKAFSKEDNKPENNPLYENKPNNPLYEDY